MKNYVFIISSRGARTNICSTFELVSLEMLIKYIQEDLKTIQENKGREWSEQKEPHFLGRWWKSVRVGKIDDKSFNTRILKYITLEEFEEIFGGHIDDIQPMLEYRANGDKYFKSEVLKKYGVKIG